MTHRRSVFGVGITASALRDRSDDPAVHRALHEDLLEDLAVHGRLVFTSEAELARFVAAVRSLPTPLAKAWETVLSSRRVSVAVAEPEAEPGLGEMLDAGQVEQRVAPEVELVLVEADQAELLGVPPGEFSAETPGGLVEIGRLTTATRTATVLAAHQVMDAPMREGANREDEWRERLGPLTASASPIVIYDKYVGVQVARRYLYGRKFGDGLTWLLNRIGLHPGRKVRIITAVPADGGGAEPVDEKALALSFLSLKEALGHGVGLDVALVPERVRGERRIERFGHDRHIRFGDRAVLALGMGVQSFSEPRFRETITVARLPVADAKGREERAMKAAVRPPREGWLGWARSLTTATPNSQ
ncbi:MAG: hypothetical protein U0R64_04060 [Candidatus Nanopelagicales bacterium]